jgi:hypothetical protein
MPANAGQKEHRSEHGAWCSAMSETTHDVTNVMSCQKTIYLCHTPNNRLWDFRHRSMHAYWRKKHGEAIRQKREK